MNKPGLIVDKENRLAFLADIGRRIKNARRAAGKSQRELANRLGVDQGTMSHYEVGSIDMPLSRLHAISVILHMTPAELVGGIQVDDNQEDRRIPGQLTFRQLRGFVKTAVVDAMSDPGIHSTIVERTPAVAGNADISGNQTQTDVPPDSLAA